jgi:SulP family sulfate permease
MAGLVSGMMGVLFDIAFAAFIFTGELERYLPIGVGTALCSAIIARLMAVSLSSFPTLTADIDSLSIAILAISTATITSQLVSAEPEALLSTVLVTIALTTALTGVFLLTLGQLKVGSLVRFVPYPVIGGFLAGTGWLLLKGALDIMTEQVTVTMPGMRWVEPEGLIHWLPGAAFALAVLYFSRRYQHWSVMPVSILGAIVLFYSWLLIGHISIEEAIAQGWLLKPFRSGIIWQPLFLHPERLQQANWSVIFGQLGNVLTVAVISPVTILLNSSALELVTRSDLNLNQELRVTGLINLVSSSGGGMTSFHSLSDSTLVYRMGARSRIVGLITASVIAAVLLLGSSVISLFPKFVLGGVLLFFGLAFLLQSLYEDWVKLTKIDYLVVWIILLVIGAVGFLQGVGVGLLFAVILFVINYSRIEVTKHATSGSNCQSRVQRPPVQDHFLKRHGEQIYILELQGLIFFGTAYTLLQKIRDRIQESEREPLKFCILDFRQVRGLDSSGLLSFAKLKQITDQVQVSLILTHLPTKAEEQLERGGFLESSQCPCRIFPDLDRGLEWCENEVLEQNNLRRLQFLPLSFQLKNLFLEPQEIACFVRYLEKVRLAEGEFLFQTGDEPQAIYFVESGQLSTFVDLGNGKTRRIRTLIPGTMLGEVAFNAQASYQACAIADQPTKVYRITHDRLHCMELEQPEIAAKFSKFINRQLAERLNFALQEIDNLLA